MLPIFKKMAPNNLTNRTKK